MNGPLKVAFRAYVIIAIAFLITLFWHPYPGSTLIKPLPLLILAAMAWTKLSGSERWIMTLAFLCSACGDALLDIDRSRFFVPALVSFMLTQILYAVAFLRSQAFNARRLLAAMGVIIFSLVITVILWSSLGELRIPVLVYIVVITFMGVAAAFRAGEMRWVFTGACIFILSDAIIAITKFVAPFEHQLMVIIGLYFMGQFLIGRGVLSDENAQTSA